MSRHCNRGQLEAVIPAVELFHTWSEGTMIIHGSFLFLVFLIFLILPFLALCPIPLFLEFLGSVGGIIAVVPKKRVYQSVSASSTAATVAA